jgi:hypothetical protein
LSRRVPPNEVSTSVPKPPNTANTAICSLCSTLKVSASKHGMTIVARSARTAAGTDHATRHHGAPGWLGAGTEAAGPCTPVVEEAAL